MDVNAFLGYSLEDGKIASHDPNQQKIYLDPGVAAEWLRVMEEDGQEPVLPDNVVIIDPSALSRSKEDKKNFEFDPRIDGLLRYAPSDGQIYMDTKSAGIWCSLMKDEGVLPMIPENIIVVDHVSSMITEPYDRNNPDHPRLSENIKTVGYHQMINTSQLFSQEKPFRLAVTYLDKEGNRVKIESDVLHFPSEKDPVAIKEKPDHKKILDSFHACARRVREALGVVQGDDPKVDWSKE